MGPPRNSSEQLRWRLAVAVAVTLLALVPLVSGAVFTVDLGSESMKVAVVNPRPGQSPISIAINEMSKRKSPSLVAISNGDRLLSEEAAGIAARYPDRVYSRARDMVGLPLNEVKDLLKSSYLPYDVVGGDGRPEEETEDDSLASEVISEVTSETEGEAASGRSSGKEDKAKKLKRKRPVRIRTHDGSTEYSAEELLAMQLGYARGLAEAHGKAGIVDAVVSVPAYFSQSQRQSIIDAGALVGVNVMALIQEHAGVALQYGMDKDFSNGSRHVVIFDMGATTTYAAVIYYSAYATKERGKSITVNQFQVKSVRWDAELGGQTLEARLLEHFVDEFNGKHSGVDIRSSPKAIAKLKKQVKRTKEILSANMEAPISVESLYDDHDFRSSITREKFEELCADVWPRVVAPLQGALADANITMDDVYAVELVGGATRVPKVQSVLTEALGGNRSLDRHLDADEALALGASLLAANLSDGFKLNRRIGMIDGLPFAVKYRIEPLPVDGDAGSDGEAADASEGPVVEELLFPRLKKMPIKIIRSLKEQASDFTLSFLYDESQGLPPRWPKGAPISTLHVSGVAKGIAKYSSYNLTHPIRASLHFHLTRSGTVGLEKAELVVEFTEWIEVPVIPPPSAANATANATGNATAGASANATVNATGDGAADAAGAGEDGSDSAAGGSEKDAAGEGGSDAGSEGAGEKGEKGEDGEKGEKEKKGEEAGKKEESPKVEMRRKLRKRTIRVPLQVSDVTEGFQRMMTDEEMTDAEIRLDRLRKRDEEKRAIAEAKNTLEAYIYSMKDKMESEEDLIKVTTEEQRDSFRSQLVDAEDWLYMDGENAKVAEFKAKLADLKKTGDAFMFRKNELTARPAAVGVGRSFADSTYDLLESWRTDKPWLNATTDIDPVLADVEAFVKWLDDKTAAQSKKRPHEDPAFSSKDVYSRVDTIEAKVNRIKRIPKPKPKKVPAPPASRNATAGNSTSNSTNNSTTDTDKSTPPPADSEAKGKAAEWKGVRDEL
ncbi:hypothetical protein CLOM_g22591 [Closterium sp. NIES-68]|nr:hypothetical protein CLOM_g22591 [Closterium sp. NIES-68]GJP84378.1 hypothetical protein CLOP_g14436 [Closterium sp. NIES-67]